MELLTSGEMKAVEALAMGSGRVSGRALMERAGAGVVAAALDWRPDLAWGPRRAVVFCGPGNNGGDGFVAARLLAARGWAVALFAWGDPARRPADAAAAAADWTAAGGATRAWDRAAILATGAAPPDLYVDALFGGGLTRPLPEAVIEPLAELYVRGATFGRMLAVDGPSGLCLDSGRALGDWDPVFAWATVTFHRPRAGHHLAEGPAACGALHVVDIGLTEAETRAAAPRAARLVGPPDPDRLLKGGAGHKYDHGHALVLAGGVGRGGAARLAARAALRVGAGLVTVGAPPAALIENAARLDAVMLRRVADGAALEGMEGIGKVSALCLGPGLGAGLGSGERTAGLVAAARRLGKPCVLDADALSVFAERPSDLFAQLGPDCVLTPHMGEFRRLFPDLAARLAAPAVAGPAVSRLDVAREAAARAGAVVLLKGPDTAIAAPDGRAALHSAAHGREAPWLATAGSGDVLAGLICGLLARGWAAFEAAQAAAWLHAEAARAFGPGLIAEDLPEALPAVFRALASRA
ncbi:MAG: NAD(P)H-hydrate dehydratase [Pseudomonadota bacterium]|nr:NAD(P)H-hydrate dehydratase [Pseudomonadota bacterium]